MTSPDEEVFAASARLRRALADLAEQLSDEQLATESLCAGWDARTVVGHLVAAVASPNRVFALAVLRAGGNLHRANDRVSRAMARRPVPELADLLRQHADSRFAPPVTGPRAPLTDLVVHTGDVLVPLGLSYSPDPGDVRTCLEFVTTGRPVGFVPRGRLSALRLTATDLPWSHGDGPEVTGRGVDLLMAACGRRALLERLAGPGSELLAARLS